MKDLQKIRKRLTKTTVVKFLVSKTIKNEFELRKKPLDIGFYFVILLSRRKNF
jgi:hypothetical protein